MGGVLWTEHKPTYTGRVCHRLLWACEKCYAGWRAWAAS